jgi:hypothetical protein
MWVMGLKPSQQCYTSGHAVLTVLSLCILGGLTLGWPLWYAKWVHGKTVEERKQLSEKWGIHYEMLKPEKWFFFLGAYLEITIVAFAEVMGHANPEAKFGLAAIVISAQVIAALRLKPNLKSKDDWIFLSIELPLLFLMCINYASTTGAMSQGLVHGLTWLDISLVFVCFLIHIWDVIFHLFFKKSSSPSPSLETIQEAADSEEHLPPPSELSFDAQEEKEHHQEEIPLPSLSEKFFGLFPHFEISIQNIFASPRASPPVDEEILQMQKELQQNDTFIV